MKIDQRLRILALGLFVACAGCPGSLEDPARFTGAASSGRTAAGGNGATGTASCDDAPRRIFAQRCVNAGCHNARDQAQGLDLESDGLVTRLVDVRASEGAGLLINR